MRTWLGLVVVCVACSSDPSAPGNDAAATGDDGAAPVSDAAPGADVSNGVDAGVDSGPPTKPLWVVGGYEARRLVSSDGKSFINDTSNPPNQLDDIITGLTIAKGLILATAHSGAYVSKDEGKTWKKLPPPLPQQWPGLGGGRAIFDGAQFIVVASDSIYTSPDTVTWSVKDDQPRGATHWQSITQGNGHIVVVGDSNDQGGNRKVSEDGVTWHDYMQGGPHLTGVAFGNGVFVLVGDKGKRAWSANGASWTDVSDPKTDAHDVVFANNQFYAYGSECWVSADGKAWTSKTCTNPPYGVSYSDGVFLGVSWESNIWSSSDGLMFTKVFSGANGTSPLLTTAGGRVPL